MKMKLKKSMSMIMICANKCLSTLIIVSDIGVVLGVLARFIVRVKIANDR